MPKKPEVTLNAPILAVDLAAEGWEIWPCTGCLPWHLEVIRHEETGEVLVREWHAAECPVLAELLNNADDTEE